MSLRVCITNAIGPTGVSGSAPNRGGYLQCSGPGFTFRHYFTAEDLEPEFLFGTLLGVLVDRIKDHSMVRDKGLPAVPTWEMVWE